MSINPRAVYRPVLPNDERILGVEPIPSQVDNSLYYRSGLDVDVSLAQQAALKNPGSLTLPDLQYVVEDAWKKEHGTFGAVDRFSAKLREELMELKDAIHEPGEGIDDATTHIVSELGDVYWCGMALTSNAGVNLDGYVKDRLFDYVRGVVYWVDGSPVEPGWRADAAQLATKWGPLTIDDIDGLFSQGFETLPSTDMNVFSPPNEEGFIEDYWLMLAAGGTQLITKSEEQYAHGGQFDGPGRSVLVTQSGFDAIGRDIGAVAAQMLLDEAHMAHLHLGTTLAEVVRQNASKLQPRVQAGLVDKQDGVRSDSLK